jgi:hypothetical protein
MARSLVMAGVCLAIATACNIESHEGDVNDSCGDAGAAGQSAATGGGSGDGGSAGGAGATANGGNGGSGGGSGSGSGGSAAAAGRAGAAGAAGGSTPPTCADWTTELECVAQTGCEPVYAGVDCSCGADCACVGGEPNCVCSSFEFFECRET